MRPLWPTCRACGTLLMQPPAPPAREPVAAVAAPRPEEQFFAPAVLRPIAHDPASAHPARAAADPRAGRWITIAGVVAFVAAVGVVAWFALKPGSGSGRHQAPVALAPNPATNAIPTSLSGVVRIQAESARHNAIQAVEYVGRGDLSALAAAQSSFTWVGGEIPSTGPKQISVAQDDTGAVTVAVAATNHDVCAFGRWSPGGFPVYVTMAHQPACSAANAPAAGWSPEPGGAFSDLPDANG